MSKQAEKRIALAKRVLETTDKTKLEAVEIALLGPAPVKFTKKELDEMELLADRMEQGHDPSHSWAEVKRQVLRRRTR
ncbi:MAG: hypothetical protein IPI81_12015 [Flavobacteriales bacterium]|nr:hypothetical protein [Flavobacteriales bacterium]MCC6939128.1 hypothetical protein [Flavobacteriales bacterium]